MHTLDILSIVAGVVVAAAAAYLAYLFRKHEQKSKDWSDMNKEATRLAGEVDVLKDEISNIKFTTGKGFEGLHRRFSELEESTTKQLSALVGDVKFMGGQISMFVPLLMEHLKNDRGGNGIK